MRVWLLRSTVVLLPLAACTSILGVDGEYEAGKGGGAATSTVTGASTSVTADASSGTLGGGGSIGTVTAAGPTSSGSGPGPIDCDEPYEADILHVESITSRARPALAYKRLRAAHLVGAGSSEASVWTWNDEATIPDDVVPGASAAVSDAVLVEGAGLVTLSGNALTLWRPMIVPQGIPLIEGFHPIGVDLPGIVAGPPFFAEAFTGGFKVISRTGASFAIHECTIEKDNVACGEVTDFDPCAENRGEVRWLGFVHGAENPTPFWLCGTELRTLGGQDDAPVGDITEAAVVGAPLLILGIDGGAVTLRSAGDLRVRFGTAGASAPTMVTTGVRIVAGWVAGTSIQIASCTLAGGELAVDSCQCRTLAGGTDEPALEAESPFLAVEGDEVVLGFSDLREPNRAAAVFVDLDLP